MSKKENKKYKFLIKAVFTFCLALFLLMSLFFPFFDFKKSPFKEIAENFSPQYAKAHYQYAPASQSIIYGRSKTNDFRALGLSDAARWEIGTVAQGLDVVLNFTAVNPRSANKIIVVYRGLTSSVSLTYQIQLCDFATSTGVISSDANCPSPGGWRNITDHGSTDPNASSSLASDRSYLFHIFNGYFAGTSGNNPINTPISNFINNGDMKLRFFSGVNTSDLMLYLDFLQIEVVVDNFYSAGAIDIGNETVSAGQYTDTYVQDVARAGTCSGVQCFQMTNSGDGLSTILKFKNVATPYQGANTILVYEQGYITANNYYIDLCNSFNATPSCLAWDTLNVTPFSDTTAIYHTVAKSGIATTTNYINNQNEIWVRIRNPAATGNYRMDYISVTVGSTNNNTAQSEISLGANGTNDSTHTATLDNSTTSTSTLMWQVNSALRNASALQTTMYSDDAIAGVTNYGVAVNVSMPVTPPTDSLVTEIIWAARWTMSGDTTITTAASLRTYSRQWRQFVAETSALNNNQMFQMGVYGACTPCNEGTAAPTEGVTYIAYGPIPRNHSTSTDTAAAGWMEGPAVGIAPAVASGAEAAVSPWESVDPVTNLANLRIRTTASTRTTAGVSLLWDFAFISIRYIDGIYPTAKAKVTAQNGGVVTGLNIDSNWRFTLDSAPSNATSQSWNINDNTGIANAWLEFSTSSLPSTANKLILTTRIGANVDAANLLLMICDFATSTGRYGTTTQCADPGGWRVLNHAAGGYAYDYSAPTALNIFQFEIYNGYFGTSTTVYNTPLSNFFQNGVARIRLLESGAGSLTYYWKFAQLEIATDNFYSPAEYQPFVVNTTTGSYIDAYMPDTCASPYRCFGVSASSTNNINYYLKFKNIATPYPGANAIYVDTTIATAAAATVPFSVRICNFTKAGGNCTATNGWENLNSLQLYPSNTLTRYQFIKKVSKWSDYINSSNEIWIAYYGVFTAGFTLNLDYSQIAVGSVAENTAKSDVSYGSSYLGDALLTADADNSVLVWDQKNSWLINSYSRTSRSTDYMQSVSAGIKVPAALPERALPTAIIWAAQSWQVGAFTVQARFRNFAGDYDVATNGGKMMTSVSGVADYITTNPIIRADATFTITDPPLRGVYIINPEDYIDTVNNEIGWRWVTTAAVTTAEGQLYWDYTFITLRYLIPDSSLNNSYRWYQNIDNATPTTALASENQPINNSSSSAVYRLRVNLLASGSTIAAGTQFKLQYSEGITARWFDVGATTSSAVWRFSDNPSVTTGTTLPSSLLTDSNVLETYEETNPSASSPNSITSGQKGEFDFAIQNNNAKANTAYLFRIVRSDGFVYDAFNNPPKIITTNVFAIGDGLLVYGSSAGGVTSQTRTWRKNDWSWSDEGNTLAASSTIRWVRTRASPIRNEFITAQGAQGANYTSLDILRYDGTNWYKDWRATTSSTTLGNIRFFDLAYESISGNALVVYSDNTATPKYRKYTASTQTWGDEQSISVTRTSGTVLWILTVSKSNTNEIAFAYYDSARDLNILVWDGSSWGSEPATLLEGNISQITYQSFDLDYETASGDLDLFWGSGTTGGVIMSQKLAATTTWSATSSSNVTGDLYNLDVPDLIFAAADPSANSNYIAVAIKASATDDLDATIWNGSKFIAKTPNIDPDCEAEIAGARMTDVGWVDGTAFLVYADASLLSLQWARWAPGSPLWTLQTAVLGGMGDLRSVKIYNSPDNTYAMVIHSRDFNNANTIHNLWAHIYDGINWRGIVRPDSPLETQLSTAVSAPYVPFGFAFARHTPTLTQRDYQWFNNVNSVQPGNSLAAKNASTTGVTSGTVLRLRMDVQTGVSDLTAFSQAFKLQYKTLGAGCSADETWSDVGLAASSTIWRGYNNSTPLDGELITSALLTSGNVLETYEEQNPSVVNTNFVAAGSSGEWDWVLKNYSAPAGTYCFRQVKSNSQVLTGYNNYPQLTTAAAGITISGTVYANEGKTGDVGSGVTMGISVQGGAKATTTTTSGGAFQFTGVSVNISDTITLFVDDHASYEANLITQASSSSADITDLEMYTNKIVLRHETDGPMTNNLLFTAANSGDNDIHYATSSPSNIDFDDGFEVWIDAGKTYTSGGNIEGDDIDINGNLNLGSNNAAIHGSWDAAGGSFTSSDTVTFDATSTGKTISDGGWPFYKITFNGNNGGWLYQDSTSTAPATTTVQNGEATFLNAKTGAVSVTGGTLNVDWYLGIHVVDNDDTTQNIGNATCTILEATGSSTVWKYNGSIWSSPAVSQWTVTQASGSATGTTPQPNSSGAIRIREYQKTSSATATYKYNATTTAIYFNNYDYYNDFGKYLTSTSSAESSGVDKTIYEGWHRNNISQMNGSQPYSGLNQPPQKGSWYIGMSSDLQFSVDSLSVNLDLYELNNWTATATTILTATTTYINGYSVKSYASNDGRLRLGVTSNYILRWSYANSTPALWNVYCINNPSYCGFGYTTSDNNLGGTGGAERFATSTKYAGFATSTPGDILADSYQAVYGTTTTITYKVSVAADQPNGQYGTTIFYICTVNY